MTPIDALIERAKRWATALERPINYSAFFGDSDGAMEAEDGRQEQLQKAADLRALISLASPSPAQTLARARGPGGIHYAVEVPSPAGPEDVVERVRRTVEMKIREHMMRVSQTGERDDIVAWTEEITRAALATLPPTETFQARVAPWMAECFGPEISADKVERNDRFIEEALELVQASGYTAERAHALVDYTFNRPQGEINQEVGGVMVTLAAHCLAHGVDMHAAGETELARIWTKVEKIRAKQAAKPKHSDIPVPGSRPRLLSR